MFVPASRFLKILYGLSLVLPFVLPFLVSPWVTMALGGLSFFGVFALIPLLIVLFRLYTVVRWESALGAHVTGRAVRFLRVLGIGLMCLGVLATAAQFFSKQIALGLFGKPGEANIAYFIVGVILAYGAMLGMGGLSLFELSRILGFEQDINRKLQPRANGR